MIAICFPTFAALSATGETLVSAIHPDHTLAQDSAAKALGWVEEPSNSLNYCGGYFLDQAFTYPVSVEKNNLVEITSNQTLFSQKGTSILEGKVTVTRTGQQITANKAYLYRDPVTGKLSAMDMIGNVNLREPNTLVVGKQGHYNFETKAKSLSDIVYRTAMRSDRTLIGSNIPTAETQKARKISSLTAWGEAQTFSSAEPRIYEFTAASFSTCPPVDPTWKLKASHIVLNKNTGRGYAVNARLLVKGIPVFYTPYINFPIDSRRKSGFLWPTLGANNKFGPYFLAPFYWNMAPNYDMTITPALLAKRGVQFTDDFRYLSTTNTGKIDLSIIPYDRYFHNTQLAAKENPASANPSNANTPAITSAEINRLINASPTRRGFFWRDDAQYNPHWSSHVDFNYASDDYYLRDFGSNLNEITANTLLQEGDLNFKSENWNFIGRLQTYQTLHPVDSYPVQNQYRRLPQLIFNGDYPDQPFGLEYFIDNEITHFEFQNAPGTTPNLPVGNRMNVQPGISWPLYSPAFYLNPRLQVALTQYSLARTSATQIPSSNRRAVPIFDIASGLTFNRELVLFHHAFEQTLEPQIYYTYIPYRNQTSLPVFDTTVNTLTYDQIFNYNRFSGIDRIGDANQIGVGVTSRFLDQNSGVEKIRLGVGDIIYFADRRVTLCNTQTGPVGCTDAPQNPNDHYRLSPVSGFANYTVNPDWSLSDTTIWNPTTKQLDNNTIGVHYEPNINHIINFGYSFVRNGDPFSGIMTNTAQNNLKLTDISFSWPVIRENISAVGRWTEDWSTNHFQNLLYGVQYDTCCWAVRLVGGRTFTNIVNNTLHYNNEYYIQFALKGLGEVGPNPTKLLSTISGYPAQFGQDIY